VTWYRDEATYLEFKTGCDDPIISTTYSGMAAARGGGHEGSGATRLRDMESTLLLRRIQGSGVKFHPNVQIGFPEADFWHQTCGIQQEQKLKLSNILENKILRGCWKRNLITL